MSRRNTRCWHIWQSFLGPTDLNSKIGPRSCLRLLSLFDTCAASVNLVLPAPQLIRPRETRNEKRPKQDLSNLGFLARFSTTAGIYHILVILCLAKPKLPTSQPYRKFSWAHYTCSCRHVNLHRSRSPHLGYLTTPSSTLRGGRS